MGILPVKRSNRQNTFPRDAAAIRLRRRRLSPLAAAAADAAGDGSAESANVAAGGNFESSQYPISVDSLVTSAESSSVPGVTDGSLEAALSARIIDLRDQLLEQLQSSFAGLRADQEFAWSEQAALLKSLSAEIGEVLTSGPVQVSPASPAERPQTTPRQPTSRAQPILSDSRAAEGGPVDSLQRWEAIRRNFLETDGADLLQQNEDPAAPGQMGSKAAQAVSADSLGKATVSPASATSMGTWIPRDEDAEFAAALPEPIDDSILSDSELREVFRSRERIMAEVIGRYRRRRENGMPLLSAEQLRGLEGTLPAALAPLVAESLQRIDELTRLGEVEMAFERARLSRERKQLEQSRFLLEHQARQMGLTLKPDGSLERTDTSTTRQKERRWLGKLGFGNQQD
jgi:hypothetical protein